MDRHTIGRCSVCGGAVKQYRALMIVGDFPPAECDSCGATERVRGPVIPMEPSIPMEPRRFDDPRGTFRELRTGDPMPGFSQTLCSVAP